MNRNPDMIDEGCDPYEALTNAIISQAAKDLRSRYRKYLRTPEAEEPKKKRMYREAVYALIDFFYGDWYEKMTNLNPSTIVDRILDEEDTRFAKHHSERRTA